MKAMHKFLGEVKITPECRKLDSLNPSPSSMFIEHDGKIKEVTKSLVKILDEKEKRDAMS